MCWMNPKQCRRTKTCCEKPECLAREHQHFAEEMRKATAIYHAIIEELRNEGSSVPKDEKIH